MSKDVAWLSHSVKQEDSLDSLALKYYGNPTFWWIIAYFNDIPDAFELLCPKYATLKIPSVSKVQFGADR
jgi:nucleoid-associated protein YgaU